MATTAASWSLQSRVQLIVLLALCIGLAVGTASMYKAAIVQDDLLTDERVELLAKSMLSKLVEELDGPSQNQAHTSGYKTAQHFAGPDHRFQIWAANGNRLITSHRAPISRPFLPVNFTGYRQVLIDGIYYCAFSAATPDGSLVVQVAEPTPSRLIPVGWLAFEYLAFALIPFSVILLFNRLALKRFFRPVEAVAENLSLRSPGDATQIEEQDLPLEISPLVHSLNAHLQRMDHALSVESRFTSVAAHELKTPLAGIRGQAQLAKTARNPEELKDALAAVMRGVDASSHIVDQLMDFHRVDSLGVLDAWRGEVTDLAKLHQLALMDFQSKADAKNIKLKIAFDIDKMHGFEFAIWTLLRNLIGNALNYTPSLGRIEVRIKLRDLRVVLTVDDSGPGIPASNRQRALKKFDRLGRSGSDGVGLGLSIVASVATAHQALMELKDSPLGGLRVEVQFHSTELSEQSGKDQSFLITTAGNWSNANRP